MEINVSANFYYTGIEEVMDFKCKVKEIIALI